MDSEEFRKWSRRAADWGVDYRDTLRADRVVGSRRA
jgi:aromatic-L-amino-acid decarboxylase